MGLSAEHEEGLPVDEEGVVAVLFDEGGNGVRGRLGEGRSRQGDKGET